MVVESSTAEPGLSVTSSESSQHPYLHDPEVQLMLRTREGDDDAFTELVETYQNRLVGIFYHMLQDQEGAEDLAQEVFLRVYRARESYEPRAKFSTWLFRIANNLASNLRRSRGRRREVPLNLRDSGPLGTRPEEKLIAEKSALMPVRQIGTSEDRALVQEALETLNDRQRMALLLKFFEGMSYADIAVAMEMTPAAVKSLLSRARESLKQKLEVYLQ